MGKANEDKFFPNRGDFSGLLEFVEGSLDLGIELLFFFNFPF